MWVGRCSSSLVSDLKVGTALVICIPDRKKRLILLLSLKRGLGLRTRPPFFVLAADPLRISSSSSSALHALAPAASLVASHRLPRSARVSAAKTLSDSIDLAHVGGGAWL